MPARSKVLMSQPCISTAALDLLQNTGRYEDRPKTSVNPAIESPKHSNNGAIHLSKEFMPGPKQESGKKASSLCKYQTGLVAMRVFARDATLHGDKDLIVEYQTGEDASNFILYRSKEQNGILQKFLQPNTPKVVSYRLYWTRITRKSKPLATIISRMRLICVAATLLHL